MVVAIPANGRNDKEYDDTLHVLDLLFGSIFFKSWRHADAHGSLRLNEEVRCTLNCLVSH
jgi:hypothetical protein